MHAPAGGGAPVYTGGRHVPRPSRRMGPPRRVHPVAAAAAPRALGRGDHAGTGAQPRGVHPGELETWGVVGLLHDFDYERFPTDRITSGAGWRSCASAAGPSVIRAVGAHAVYTGIARDTPLEKAILAADELAGFVGACALVRPSEDRGSAGRVGGEADEGEGVRALGGPELHHPRGRGMGNAASRARRAGAARAGGDRGEARLDGAPAADLPDAPVPTVPSAR